MSSLSRRGFLAGSAAVAAASSLPAQASTPRNVLIVCSDEHNPHLMGHAGHPLLRTPAMDRLAEANDGTYKRR